LSNVESKCGVYAVISLLQCVHSKRHVYCLDVTELCFDCTHLDLLCCHISDVQNFRAVVVSAATDEDKAKVIHVISSLPLGTFCWGLITVDSTTDFCVLGRLSWH